MKGLYRLFAIAILLATLTFSRASDPVLLGQWMTVPTGHVENVMVADNRAWLAIGSGGVVLVDVTNPTEPQRLGGFDTAGTATDVAVDGNLAVVADGAAGVQFIDFTDPANPILLGNYKTVGFAGSLQISATHAFVADNGFGLQIVDFSNPSAPRRINGYATAGSTGGRPQVRLEGSRAYLLANGIITLDVTNPGLPVYLGRHDIKADNFTVSGRIVYSTYLGDLTTEGGLTITDLSQPNNAVLLGSYLGRGGYRFMGVTVVGKHALLSVYGPPSPLGFLILDVSDPASPLWIGAETSGPSGQSGPAVSGNVAYLPIGPGIRMIDFSSPANPTAIGIFDTAAQITRAIVQGNYAYAIGDAFRIIDISDISRPRLAGIYRRSNSGLQIAIKDNLALIAAGDTGLQIFDVSNPAQPTLVSTIWQFRDYGIRVTDVLVIGGLVYIANEYGNLGMLIADVTNPANPVVWQPGARETIALARQGNYLYSLIPSGNTILAVYDISNPRIPVTKYFKLLSRGYGSVAVSGNALVLSGRGVQFMDISNPINPLPMAWSETPEYPNDLAAADNLAFVGGGASGGFQVFDLTNLTPPARVSSYKFPPYAGGITVSGNMVVLANGFRPLSWGPLQFLDISGVNRERPSVKMEATSDSLRLHISGETGRRYILDQSSTLPSASWNSSPAITFTNGSHTITIPFSEAATQQFYRARLAP